MSVARLIAISGRPQLQYVGMAAHAEFSDGVPWHPNARAGDFAIIYTYSSAGLSGGSSTPWNTFSAVTNGTVRWRRLEADDLSGSMQFSIDTPVITKVWRGPGSVSSIRTTGDAGSGSDFDMPGFTASGGSLATVCFTTCEDMEVGAFSPSGFDFTFVGPEALSFGFGHGLKTNTGGYTAGTLIGPSRNASICELLL